jgi:hypothetical protein
LIAALFVDPKGVYANLPGVDLWDEARDARTYPGPYPVIAHPPCSRWCRLAGLVEARWGYPKGKDNGEFEAALNAVRRWGGVLEHPAYSDAWAAYKLNRPPTGGGWVNADFQGGWTCYVEQGRYGHPARKATWLYAIGGELKELRWGVSWGWETVVSNCGNSIPLDGSRKRIVQSAAAKTPIAFRDELVRLAASVAPEEE